MEIKVLIQSLCVTEKNFFFPFLKMFPLRNLLLKEISKKQHLQKITFLTGSVSFPLRTSDPSGSGGVGSLHVLQGSSAAALDRHGQHGTGARHTVARTAQTHLTLKASSYE